MENSKVKVGFEMVSIRCRRHKRRFDVPREWADGVCSWLCPKCFESLSPRERDRYAPSDEPEVRPPEGSRVCLPSGWLKDEGVKSAPVKPEEFAVKGKAKGTKRKAEKPVAKEAVKDVKDEAVAVKRAKAREDKAGDGEETGKPVGREDGNKSNCVNEESKPVKAGFRGGLASLLPSYRIYCHKCKMEQPCHGTWFSISTTMCPMCYSQSSITERDAFEKSYGCKYQSRHKNTDAKSTYVRSCDVRRKATVDARPASETPFVCHLEDLGRKGIDILIDGPKMGFDDVRRMSERDLVAAVRRGTMSKTRANIERRRRQQKGHYNNLPDRHGTPIPYFR